MNTVEMKPLPPLLIVEDNKINQQLLTLQLKRIGITNVVVVENGIEALTWLENHKCIAILTDCLMPGMDGYQLTRQIREREKIAGEHVTIIAISACVMAEDRNKCFEAGMDAHVSKPIQLADLREALSFIRADS